MPSRVRKYNFCNPTHRFLYTKSDRNVDFGKGWHQKPESRKKIGRAGIGRKPTQDNIEKLKEVNRNRVWTDKQREEARQRKLGNNNTEEQNKKIKEHARYGENNIMWKGDFASYYAMHAWVTRHKGKAKKCVDSVTNTTPCKGRFEWSNVDHEYQRIQNDYIERCTLHHRMYDYLHGLTKPEGKTKRFFAKFRNIKKSYIRMDGIIVPVDNTNLKLSYL